MLRTASKSTLWRLLVSYKYRVLKPKLDYFLAAFLSLKVALDFFPPPLPRELGNTVFASGSVGFAV